MRDWTPQPILRVARSLRRRLKRFRGARSSHTPPHLAFSTSDSYWEERYRAGGNSGSGSYGRLAQFKADFLNRFVAANGIQRVVEFGSGDGAQLALAKYPSYVGVDISPTAVEHCRSIFKNRSGYRFEQLADYEPVLKADLSLSLDVIYHLVENEIFEDHMRRLFDATLKYVIIYASNFDEHSVPHVRHRCFTNWVDANRRDFRLICHQLNTYSFDHARQDDTSFADFYVYERL